MPSSEGVRMVTGCTLVAAACCLLTSTPSATGQVGRPATAGRIVKLFDFEEQTTNPSDVPRYWYRAQDDKAASRERPGFPPWNEALLVYKDEGGLAFSGVGAVKAPTDGGSTSLALEGGVIPIFPQADYAVSARIRTDGLKHAGARVIARYLDRTGKPIPGSTRESEIIRSDDWVEISVELLGEYPEAADIQIELCLLQPSEAGELRGARSVNHQDVAGAAWFDDVAVVQLPRVELTTSAPLNVGAGPRPPEVLASIRDLTGEELRVEFAVMNSSGKTVDRFVAPESGGAIETTWTPKLARFGWYRVRMDVVAPSGRVGSSFVDMVWLPPRDANDSVALDESPARTRAAASRDRDRFGILLHGLPDADPKDLALMLRAIGSGRVTIPLWPSHGAAPSKQSVLAAVDELLGGWQEVSFALERVPPALALATRVPTDDPWTLLMGENGPWLAELGDYFDRYGQRVRRWQVGAIGDDRGFWRADAKADLERLERGLAKLVSGPKLAVPSRIDRAWNPASLLTGAEPATALAVVPPEMPEEAVGLGVRAFMAATEGLSTKPEFTVVMPMFPQERYGMNAGPSELVKRSVEAWAASPDVEPVITIEQPWEVSSTGRPKALPRPELAAWSNLIDRLGDRRVVGVFPVTEGIACYILAPAEGVPPERGGALVAWNRSALPSDAVIEAYLGDDPLRIVDLYGNASEASAAPPVSGRRPGVRVPIGDEPIFIEGIDVELCRFISSFRLEPAFIESTNNQHERSLIIQNPWPVVISGKVSILEPGGYDAAKGKRDRDWRISPRTLPFTVEPRGTVSEPFTIAFSPTEEQGRRPFVVNIDLVADKQYGTLTIRRSIEIGLNSASMELSYSLRGPGANDLVVEAAVSNTGTEPLMMEMTCFAPDLPRVKNIVADLVPGRQSVKRFVFSGQANNLRGKRIIVSAVTPEGGARLNKSILIQ
ncbi:MAG: hypothetical protein ACOYN0_12325 [Phycisphaerales bacterium]